VERVRQRWIGRVSVGFTAMGKCRIVTVSGRTKTEAKAKLREVMRDHQAGFPTERVTARSPRRWRTGWRTGWVYRAEHRREPGYPGTHPSGAGAGPAAAS
jgi:hypothetical protein